MHRTRTSKFWLCLTLMFLFCQVTARGGLDQPLQYKAVDDSYYFVEMDYTYVRRHINAEEEVFRETCVIKCDQVLKDDDTRAHARPQKTLLKLEGSEDAFEDFQTKPFPPAGLAYPTGKVTKYRILPDGTEQTGVNWIITDIARSFRVFPIFPNQPVQENQTWKVRMDICFPDNYKAVMPIEVRHHLKALERANGRTTAVIEYAFSHELDTATQPEMQQRDGISEFVKQNYTVNGRGEVEFDITRGIVTNKKQHIEWNTRWTEPLPKDGSAALDIQGLLDSVFSFDTRARLIEEKEALRLIKEAKALQTGPPEPEADSGPSWKYLVERRTTSRGLAPKKERVYVDRAFVHYGARAKQAGGQYESAPQVVYIDEDDNRLNGFGHMTFEPIGSDKLTMTDKLPWNYGRDPNLPLPVSKLAKAFDMLPLERWERLQANLRTVSTLHLCFMGIPKLSFPAAMNYQLRGYEKKKGRKCAVIDYTIAGTFKSSEHPERFTEEQMRKGRLEGSLKGGGFAYVDLEAGIIVEKQQAVAWSLAVEQLTRLKNGERAWVPDTVDWQLVEITVEVWPLLRVRGFPNTLRSEIGFEKMIPQHLRDSLKPSVEEPGPKSRKADCKRNLRHIGVGIVFYRNDNADEFPATLANLYPKYMEARTFVCPGDENPRTLAGDIKCSYHYVGKLLPHAPDTAIIVYEKAGNHEGGRHVIVADGHVKWIEEDEFEARMKQSLELLKGEGWDKYSPEQQKAIEAFYAGQP